SDAGSCGRRPPHTVVDAGEGTVRRRQVRVDVVRRVEVAVRDELASGHETPRQPTVDADVRAPRLRESEVLIGDVQLVTRGGSARDARRLVLVRIRVERVAGCVVVLHEAGQHAGVADLVRDPDVRWFAGEHTGAAAQL